MTSTAEHLSITVLAYDNETYMIFLGTFGMATLGLKMLSKNVLTILLKTNEGQQFLQK